MSWNYLRRKLCRSATLSRRHKRNSPDTTYSLKHFPGWFFPCIRCSIRTSNEISYIILIRNDYEQVTVTCCRHCRNKLYNKVFTDINEIHFTPHKIVRIAKLNR